MMIGAFQRNVRITTRPQNSTRESLNPPRQLSTRTMVPYQSEEKVKLCAIVRHCVKNKAVSTLAFLGVPHRTCPYIGQSWTRVRWRDRSKIAISARATLAAN